MGLIELQKSLINEHFLFDRSATENPPRSFEAIRQWRGPNLPDHCEASR
jgi:hypothetical protein